MGTEAANSIPRSSRPTTSDWLRELRAPFLTASIIPVLVGGALAWTDVISFDWPLYLWTMVGVVLLHLGANVTNDYFDYMGGTDVINVQRTPFSGGSGLLVERRLSPRRVLRMGQLFLAMGAMGAGFGMAFISQGTFLLNVVIFLLRDWLGLISI